jgi:hypothetical protein
MHGSRFKVQGSRFKVQGSRFKVQGSRFKIYQPNCVLLLLTANFICSDILKRFTPHNL